MKIGRSVLSILAVTFFSLFYVHLQVELVKMSYLIEHKEKRLKDMLDYKESIGYTIKNLESPARLEKILISKNIDVAFPKVSQVVAAGVVSNAPVKARVRKAVKADRRFDIFGLLDLLNPNAEAQANE